MPVVGNSASNFGIGKVQVTINRDRILYVVSCLMIHFPVVLLKICEARNRGNGWLGGETICILNSETAQRVSGRALSR